MSKRMFGMIFLFFVGYAHCMDFSKDWLAKEIQSKEEAEQDTRLCLSSNEYAGDEDKVFLDIRGSDAYGDREQSLALLGCCILTIDIASVLIQLFS